MEKLRELLPPNRVAMITGVLLSIAAFIASLETSFVPGSPAAEAIAKAAALIASILTVWRLLEKFLDGAQNWDSLMVAGVPKVRGVSAPVQGNEELFTTPLPQEDVELSGELTAEGMALYDEEMLKQQAGGLVGEEEPGPRAVPPTLYDQEDKPK